MLHVFYNTIFLTRFVELRGLDLQTGSFTLRQLKAATNDFDPANKIGEGGFGSVFKVYFTTYYKSADSVLSQT